jgi:hypothetical protein
MTATPATQLSELESAQVMVSTLQPDQLMNALEHLAGAGAVDEFGAEYVQVVRRMLERRLESFRRGRRGLVSVPPLEPR